MGAVQLSGRVVTLRNGGTRRFRSTQERRQIVEETLKRGASVSLVARAHDVNANQVFKWRKQYVKDDWIWSQRPAHYLRISFLSRVCHPEFSSVSVV